MGIQSRWTDHQWGPWIGCQKISIGCWNCHTFRALKHMGRSIAVVQKATLSDFNLPLRLPRTYIQVCPTSDFFIAEADEWREEAWEIIRLTPNKRYQILTKRPGRIRQCLPANWGATGWPNVYLGVSAETQSHADRRIPQMLSIPATKYFVSAQPLLGPIDLRQYLGSSKVSMVVSGCESGPKARSADPEWLHSLDTQCSAARVRSIVSRWNDDQGRIIEGDFHNVRVCSIRNYFPFRPKRSPTLREQIIQASK